MQLWLVRTRPHHESRVPDMRGTEEETMNWTDERGPLSNDEIDLIEKNKNDIRYHRPQFCIVRLIETIRQLQGKDRKGCASCRCSFDTNYDLARHIYDVHTPRQAPLPYECGFCQEPFSTADELMTHMKIHLAPAEKMNEAAGGVTNDLNAPFGLTSYTFPDHPVIPNKVAVFSEDCQECGSTHGDSHEPTCVASVLDEIYRSDPDRFLKNTRPKAPYFRGDEGETGC